MVFVNFNLNNFDPHYLIEIRILVNPFNYKVAKILKIGF